MRLLRPAAILPLLSVLACAERGTTTGDQPVGGTVVIAAPGVLTPTLPLLVQEAFSRAVADLVYERLANIGPDLNTFGDQGFTPRLARRWTWAADSMSIAFELDPDARWHDGRPVRASDVKFTFDLIKDPRTTSPYTPLIANVDSVTVQDSLTAVAWFARRTPEQFYDFVYQLDILPEHVLSGVARDQLRAVDVNRMFIGSGPFRLSRFEPGVRIELVADTAYHRGRPKLDRVIWSASSDAGAGITAFMSGQADLLESVPADLVPRVDSNPTTRTIALPTLAYAYMPFNLRDPARRGAPHPVFGDRQVRRALSMALDRQAMARNVLGERGVVGTGPGPRVLLGDIRPLPFDRAAAGALLDSAGWRMGPDSVRAKGGRPLAFSILTPTTSAPRMRYAVLVQEQLRQVGARVTIDAVDFRAFVDRLNGRAYDATLHLWQTDPGFGGIRQTWTAEGMAANGNNHMSYANPAVDALVDSALASPDGARARGYAHRAYQMIVDDAPAVWLYEYTPMMGVHQRIRTEDLRPNGWWVTLPQWWIPEGERLDRDRIGLRPAQP